MQPPPQWLESSACSHPGAPGLLSQSSQPWLHAMEHVLFVHAATPCWAGQTFVQLPQCCRFDVRSTHAPLQSVPLAHEAAHWPAEHTGRPVAVQSLVQVPQCFAADRSVSHPLSGSASQSPTPGAHFVTLHAPALQVNSVAFDPLHATHAFGPQP